MRTILLCLFAISLAAPGASAGPVYQIMDLGTIGGDFSRAFAINNQNQIVGISNNSGNRNRPFIWLPSSAYGLRAGMNDLGTLPGGDSAQGLAISNNGYVTGWSTVAQGSVRAFLWQNGIMTNIGSLLPDGSSIAAVNSSGQVVATSGGHAFLYDGQMTDLGTFGGVQSSASDISESGQVVGTASMPGVTQQAPRAFLWDGHTLNNLGTMYNIGTSSAIALNDRGMIVGMSSSSDGNGMHGFFWENGSWTDLVFPGGVFANPTGLNNRGQVIGESSGGAFLWEKGRMQFLGDLTQNMDGWNRLEVFGINDAGYIVGEGSHLGQRRAFLLTPVPEPSSIVLLGRRRSHYVG